MEDEEVARLFAAMREVFTEWTDRLRREAGDEFPEGVTAFRPEMAVHGKFGKPCPVCGAPYSAFAMRKMKRTTVPAVRPAGRYWPIVRYHDC